MNSHLILFANTMSVAVQDILKLSIIAQQSLAIVQIIWYVHIPDEAILPCATCSCNNSKPPTLHQTSWEIIHGSCDL